MSYAPSELTVLTRTYNVFAKIELQSNILPHLTVEIQ